MAARKTNEKDEPKYQSRNLWSGILFGLGLIAFFDEMVFHQLLHWHHFYDKSTTAIGLVSDGLFHAFSWFATVGSLFMVADLRRRNHFFAKDGLAVCFLALVCSSFMTASSSTSSWGFTKSAIM
ncbi:putative membrane protein [Bacillus capparidis]|uniref:Membrane protein n=1 Tax=Bacillus capparidis TaxID=1840411 RepID=A0ABS4CX48_9BACI|nr:putative membrane protein [Bacillus capparidis]